MVRNCRTRKHSERKYFSTHTSLPEEKMTRLELCGFCERKLNYPLTLPVKAESVALQPSLFQPWLVDSNLCYKWVFARHSDEAYVLQTTKFEVLHDATKCNLTETKLTATYRPFTYRSSVTWCHYQTSFVHFFPRFPAKTCDCLVVLLAEGRSNDGRVRETLFLKVKPSV